MLNRQLFYTSFYFSMGNQLHQIKDVSNRYQKQQKQRENTELLANSCSDKRFEENMLDSNEFEETPFPQIQNRENKQVKKITIASKNIMACRSVSTQTFQQQKIQKELECISESKCQVRRRFKKPTFAMLKIEQRMFISKKKTPITEDYTFEVIIGQGSYGVVFKGFQKETGFVRAIKKIDKNKLDFSQKQHLINQLDILKQLDHPNIINLYDIYEDATYLYVVTEFCEGGNLLELVNSFSLSEHVIRIIMTQILSALKYIHSSNILHKDIKLENIVLVQKVQQATINNLRIKIIDFGISIDLKKDGQISSKDLQGTLMYMPPQSIGGIVKTAWDIWSCGVICYILATRKVPYKFKNENELLEKVQKADIRRSNLQGLSKDMKLFIMSLLNKICLNRITAERALKSMWMRKSVPKTISETRRHKTAYSLLKYDVKNNLISMIQSYIVCKKINQAQRQHLAQIFQSIDEDKSGGIEIEELKKFYSQNSEYYDEQQVQELLETMDKNKSGKLDFKQFITAMCSRRQLFQLQSVNQAFDFLDKDRSGQIDKEEILFFLKGIEHEQIDSIFKQLDENKDQSISRTEFISYLAQCE